MTTRGRPFQKGHSGNPGGRPKAIEEVRELAQVMTADALSTLSAIMKNDRSPPAARVAAANSILDRGWGRPAQGLDLKHSGSIGARVSKEQQDAAYAAAMRMAIDELDDDERSRMLVGRPAGRG